MYWEGFRLPLYDIWFVNGEIYYREKNVIGYYFEFLAESLETFEIVEEIILEVDEIFYLVNRIQDVKLRYEWILQLEGKF